MTDHHSKNPGAALEEAGFEALQRLYAEAVSDEQEKGSVCARLLLGLYNGSRFPFDLTDLRLLPTELFEDAMQVIRMDARLTRQEVHQYFSQGSKKFERTWSATTVSSTCSACARATTACRGRQRRRARCAMATPWVRSS